MTNSEKQTKSAGTDAAGTAPARASSSSASSSASSSGADFLSAAIAKRPTLVFGGVLLLIGWGFSLHINNWHLTVPVFMLWLAWLGALFTVRLLWGVGIAVAGEAGGKSMQELDVTEARRIELQEEKKSLIRAIKEIEFDRDLGKMSDDDASEMMRYYRARAIEVIKELAGSPDDSLSVQERIDRDLAARLAIEGAVSKGGQKARKKRADAATTTPTSDTPRAAESEDPEEPSTLAKSAHEEQSEAPLESA